MKTIKISARHFILTFCYILLVFKLSSINNLSILDNKSLINFKATDFPDNGKKMTIEEKIKKHEGTFQIQVKDLRYKPNIPYNIDEIIEKNRKQNETVYISLGSAVRLKILSLNEIKGNLNKKMDLISTFTN